MRIKTGAHRVFARQEGSGPDVILLHGFPTSSFDWAPAVSALRDSFRCTTLDFLGFGHSDKPRIAYRYALQVDALADVVRALGVPSAYVVAHDYGVSIAQELLALERGQGAPFRVRGVVFMNGGLDSSLHRPLLVQRLLASPAGPLFGPLLLNRATFERSLRRILVEPSGFDFDTHWGIIAHEDGHRVIPRLLSYLRERKTNRERWIRAITEARVPLGFAWGRGDPIAGAPVLDWIESALPHAWTLALDVGHYPQLEAPTKVNAWLERTLTTWATSN